MSQFSYKSIFFLALSYVLVAFGQPAWIPWLGILAAWFGYALFWKAMLTFSKKRLRFWVAAGWFSLVQLFQLSWLIAHPYAYIYLVWSLLSLGIGLQFGWISLFVDHRGCRDLGRLFYVAAAWTVLEWSRLFLLSGYVWNPVGLAYAGNLATLQVASLGGVYGMSFLVILTNLFALSAWEQRSANPPKILFAVVACAPFLFGAVHLVYHDAKMKQHPATFSALLVQPAFPVEEALHFTNRKELEEFITKEWRQILTILRPHYGKSPDLIVLPEIVVPFGTYTFIYPFEDVQRHLFEIFGEEVKVHLPALKYPLAHPDNKMVSNAYWTQALANIFDSRFVIGLEDAEDVEEVRKYYSSAIYIAPQTFKNKGPFFFQRYSKQVLVPMGEYIPFSFCRNLAAKYGVLGSFTQGDAVSVWRSEKASFGLSICYEEMFGQMMRENRLHHAEFLLNLSSDAWFPHSKLIRQHLEHSRLRTVENGFSLVRACNTGVTCVVDALGRDVAVLGESDATREDLSEVLDATFSLYNYQTLYTRFGDGLIVVFSFFCILSALIRQRITMRKPIHHFKF